MSTKKLRAAVIGVGYLGRFHAQKYAALNGIELVAVVDQNSEKAKSVAEECHCSFLTEYQSLIGKVDLVSVVVPTLFHHEVAGFFLDNGVDVLLEKPMTVTLEEADDLLSRANAKKCILQIGHLERFNPAMEAARGMLTTPAMVETTRVATFKNRGTDVSVVLDLMIHDIDLVTSVIAGEIEEIEATGVSLVTSTVDAAQARLSFASGAIAHLTVSRMAPEIIRKMRIVQPQQTLDVDFGNCAIAAARYCGDSAQGPAVREERETFASADALLSEITAFVTHVRQRSRPQVSGEEGRRALAIALEVIDRIDRQSGDIFCNSFASA